MNGVFSLRTAEALWVFVVSWQKYMERVVSQGEVVRIRLRTVTHPGTVGTALGNTKYKLSSYQ